MKLAKSIYQDCINRGYVEDKGVLYPPESAEAKRILAERLNTKPNKKRAIKGLKSGWIDDCRNANCLERVDTFTQLIKQELGLICWQEFHFHKERKWRADYAIPDIMVVVEVEGGVHIGGRHTRGVGFENDIEKYNSLTELGWRLIRVTPNNLLTNETLTSIKSFLK